MILAFLVFAWGWCLLGIWAIVILIRSNREKTSLGVRWMTCACAALMIAAAIGWEKAVRPLTFGRNYPAVTSADGQVTANVRHTGTVNYHLVVNHRGSEFELPLFPRKMPKHIFWMVDDTAIGVEYKDPEYPDLIVPVGSIHEARTGERRFDDATLAKAYNYDYLQHKLTPEEQAAFDAAKAAVPSESENP